MKSLIHSLASNLLVGIRTMIRGLGCGRKNKNDLVLRPRKSLEGRKNFKRFAVIERNGAVTERVGLYITDMRMRENVICMHYLQMLVRHILREDTGVRLVSRDSPWDFQLELSNGEAFGVEIVSIADNQAQFIINSRAERRDELARHPQITLRKLKKTASQFPDTALEQLVADNLKAGKDLDDDIENPDFVAGDVLGPLRIDVSIGDPVQEPLSERLRKAVAAKAAKNAKQKGLILIIDNRTSLLSAKPVYEAAAQIDGMLESSPFREIWFYTGYYSDFDGNNSEYSFIPLKIDTALRDMLEIE